MRKLGSQFQSLVKYLKTFREKKKKCDLTEFSMLQVYPTAAQS